MFEDRKITLASASPRRRELLAGLDLKFEVEPNKDEKEAFADILPWREVPGFLARHKSETFHRPLLENEILITADTLVFVEDGGKMVILGKPADDADAYRMVRLLAGKSHYVLTGVCLRTPRETKVFTSTTEVVFREMTDEEIWYYIEKCTPLDKAGAYGIQEWIGYAACTAMNGSYYNVMGLPTDMLFEELKKLG